MEDAQHKRNFPDNECNLEFTPVDPNQSMIQDGMNFGLVAFRQFLNYGYFTGHCKLKKPYGTVFTVDIPKSYGFVEYVFSKW